MINVCIPIIAKTMSFALRQLERAAALTPDILELRLDHFVESFDLPALLAKSPCPVIVTCRAPRQGGAWKESEESRLAVLQNAVDLGAAYVDIEADVFAAIIRTNETTKLIASWHNFTETPNHLATRVRELEALPCDIVKWATMATSLSDNLRVFESLQSLKKPGIGICMGELGEPSRILAGRFGGFLTFGSLSDEHASAPGQITAFDLIHLYRVRSLSAATRLFAVIGDPIAHSMSPEIHNTAFRDCNIDAAYLKLRVSNFQEFLRTIADAFSLEGISVTIPHKHAALEAAINVTDRARAIGAVNTLTRCENGWHGDNTDCTGALDAIRAAAKRAHLSLRNAPALLVGAGGTARAIGFGLKEEGCRISIANRTRARAEMLATDLGASIVDLSEINAGTYSVIANTTSVGMHPNIDATPIDASFFSNGSVAFDAVYNPLETRMLRDARAQQAEIATGLDMFVGQAALQFERWTGIDAPRDRMRDVVRNRLSL